MKIRKVSMRVASLFLWVVMFITAACIGYAADAQNQESSVIETATTETSDDSVYEETTESTVEETTTEKVTEWVLVEHTADDITVIPDKYNTGAKGELEVVELGATVEGVEFKASTADTRNALDFYYRNKDVEGTVIFENYDFSEYLFWVYNVDLVDREIKLVFNNCKFSEMTVGTSDYVSYEFNNCTIARFGGSNAVFNNCNMGGGCCTDGLVPFRNVEVNNCFFGNMSGVSESGKEIHTDGTQIYGYEGIDVYNVHYNNCRFEIPPLSTEGSTVYVNACLMLQMEFSNGSDISFSDCVINGGGYSIYARVKKDGYTLENVKFERIRSGCAKIYGTIYPDIYPTVELEDISETEFLYIASVWKENNSTCFSVSNDTNQERKLLVITDNGRYEYTIPACPTGTEVVPGILYEDMPFDIKITIPEDCEYAVCYDNTVEGVAKQIRFVNWTEEKVYLDKEVVDGLTSKKDEIILEGTCGADIKYTLTMSGVLTLSGQGSTDNYHTGKLAPWNEYANVIKEIVVEEGIEELGEQIFRRCIAVRDVSLPDSLKTIKKLAFSGCTSLTSITLPASIETIGNSVFASSVINVIYYEGSDWNSINLGTGNDNLASMVKYVQATEEIASNIVIQGMCGECVEFILTDDGVLRIKGTGAMYDYHSGKLPPWDEVKETITTVVVEQGVENIGNQAFKKCNNIAEVILSDGLSKIGNNAFSACKKICDIVIPKTILEIQKYAFAGISTIGVQYKGSQDEWNRIVIGIMNDSILQNVVYEG